MSGFLNAASNSAANDSTAMSGVVQDDLYIDAQIVQQARTFSAASQRNLIAELEAMTGRDQRQLLKALSLMFDMPVIETIDMLAAVPAFELLPLSKSIQRHCVVLRETDGKAIAVITDPFDLDLQSWLSSTVSMVSNIAMGYRLALQADIQVYLSKQEENVRATESSIGGAADAKRDGKTAAILSFASVSEAASPAVKLVNSTLYDALKSGASDIHLESTNNGLVVKYRVDGGVD
jgi:general secretion pathway protein E